MILKSVRLSNIRSYVSQEIIFPTGSTLLAGDIGSGKSSILAAIEFALFGVKRGELNSESLLRHGAKEGSVELNIEVDGKDVRIKRALKKGRDDIKQESGYVITDGRKKEGTAEEIKASVLELLGYPKEFLKKKELVYRYTVYTPQEEMKKIVYENKDVRLDTLRKVFNIDKYKRIIENSRVAVIALRQKKSALEGFTRDTEQKKDDAKRREIEISEIDAKILQLSPLLEQARSRVNSKKEMLAKYEAGINELNGLKRDLQVLESRLLNATRQKDYGRQDRERAVAYIEALKSELEGVPAFEPREITFLIKQKENEARLLESEYRESLKSLHSSRARIEHLKESMNKIISLDSCPLCEQNVTAEHKHSIKERESSKINALEKEMQQNQEKEKGLEARSKAIMQDIESLRKEEVRLNLINLKKKNLEDRKTEKERLDRNLAELGKEIEGIESSKKAIASKIQEMQLVEELYRNSRNELEQELKEERRIEIEKAGIEKERDALKRMLAALSVELEEKKKAIDELNRVRELENWISSFFVKLISTIEKHVMLRLHSEFNSLFREWFGTILEDETINVSLDDEFTPVIEQNGYETFLENLSGGEKTSVALAYRLALNKVINDIVAGIKTKDIIILDEPTDGFSAEQLDRIREVLEQLNMNQIIIVSHEGKIESFVQNVIRIEKHDNASVVV